MWTTETAFWRAVRDDRAERPTARPHRQQAGYPRRRRRAGTGKTFTVTRRYAEIVDQDGVEPEDVLLVTFTNNAATEMKDRIVAHCDYGMRELSDAPIQTFHSLCHDILMEHGFEAPTLRRRRPHHWVHTCPRRRERREGPVPRVHSSIQRRPPRV